MPGARGKNIPLVIGTNDDPDIKEQQDAQGNAEDDTVSLTTAKGLRVPKIRIARPTAAKLAKARVATDTTMEFESGAEFAKDTDIYLVGINNNTVKCGDRPKVWKGQWSSATNIFSVTQTYTLNEVAPIHEAAPTNGLTGDQVHVLRAFIRDPTTNYATDNSIHLTRLGPGSPTLPNDYSYEVVTEGDISAFADSQTTNEGYSAVRYTTVRGVGVRDPQAEDIMCILTPSSPATEIGVALNRGTVITRLDDSVCGRLAVNMVPTQKIRVADANDKQVAVLREGTGDTTPKTYPLPMGTKNAHAPIPFWPLIKDDGFQSRSILGHDIASVLVPFHPPVAIQAAFLVEGIEDVGDGTGNLIENASDTILEILENTSLGNVAAGDIDAASFASVRNITRGIDFGFALTESKSLLELIGDLAFQGAIHVSYDDGKFRASRVSNAINLADSVFTVTRSGATTDYAPGTLQVWQQQVDEIVTRITVSQDDKEGKAAAKSNAAETFRGSPNEINLNFWAVQKQLMRTDLARFWLQRWSDLYERVSFDLCLAGTKIRENDTITLNFSAPDTGSMFSNVAFRVIEVTDQMDAGRITITAERVLVDNEVEEIAPYSYYLYGI